MKTGAFNGWWLDNTGKRVRRIQRGEYGELYRLLSICRELETNQRKELHEQQR